MKKLKLKAFVLLMVVMMGLTLVPSLYAAERYENAAGVTEDNADIVCSYKLSKTELTPGEEFEVIISIDKLPDNGLGFRAFSNAIAYDPTQVEPMSHLDENQIKYYDLVPGEVGELLGLTEYSPATWVCKTDSSLNQINFSSTVMPEKAIKVTGEIATLKFKVKDNASGDIKLFLLSDRTEDNGFAVSGVKIEQDSMGSNILVADPEVSYYVKDGLSEQVYVPVPLEGIKFKDELGGKLDLDKTTKKSFDLSSYVELIPSNTTEDDDLEWSEDSNGKVVTVANGVVTAVGNGSANVTVKCGEFSATIPVNVTTSVGSLTFSQSNYTVNFEETRNLKDELTVNPEDAVYDKIEWSSDKPEIASVDKNGVVTGVAKGTANITAKVGNIYKTVAVTVAVPLKSVTLSTDTVTVYKGKSETVVVTPQPEGAVWESLVPSVNSGAEFVEVKDVSNGIEITGVKEGTAVVAISVNKNQTGDLYKLVNVVVKENKVTSATITNEDGAELLRGETLEMKGEFAVEEPGVESTDDTTMKWESLNPEIATVDENTGVVTGVKEGTATIKLTVAGQTDEYVVTVKEIHVDGIVISEDTQKELEALESLTVGDTIKVPFTVTPEGTITDTVDEILEFINVEYDKDLVDVTVEYNKETGEGVLTITVKAAGETSVVVTGGDPESEEATSYEFVLNCVEPVEEVPEEEIPETGDMPVVMLVAIMAVSLAGVVASKKIFVK